MVRYISNEVWDQLDPSAARLAPRARRRLMIALGALIVLVVAAVQITVSGAVVPRITTHPGWSGWFEDGTTSDLLVNRRGRRGPPPTHVSQAFRIVNEGAYPLTIVSIDADRPGMRVERVEVRPEQYVAKPAILAAGHPYPLPAGETLSVRIYYDITDCSAVTARPQPIPMVVERWFGQQRVPITLAPLRPYRKGGWAVSPGDPEAVQWQRFLADHVCGIQYPDGL
jgi:hypothetical protein